MAVTTIHRRPRRRRRRRLLAAISHPLSHPEGSYLFGTSVSPACHT